MTVAPPCGLGEFFMSDILLYKLIGMTFQSLYLLLYNPNETSTGQFDQEFVAGYFIPMLKPWVYLRVRQI